MLLFAALVVACSAARVFPEYSERLAVPQGWEVDSSTTEKPLLPLTIALTQPGAKKLSAFVDAVSNPKHENYGKYLSLEEVRAMVAPSDEVLRKVVRFLEVQGFSDIDVMKSGDLIRVKATPDVINSAFQTLVVKWHHAKFDKPIWRSVVPYSLPEEIGAHIDLVSGIHHFPQHRKGVFSIPKSQDTAIVTPSVLRSAYDVTDQSTGAGSQAVAEFQGQYYSPQDLDTFFSKFVPGGNATVAGVYGTNNANAPGVEAELDIQYIMGVNPGAPTYFYSQSSFEFWSDLTAWIAVLNNEAKPPLVHSISYGEQKEHQTSGSYKENFEVQMKKLAARGITIIFASGDDGCGCDLCIRYEPSFPASSPSVTAVGATTFQNGASGPEEAVTAFGSGGGFSWYYERTNAQYQDDAVKAWLSQSSVPSSIHFSKGGRATPDVSALGWGFQVVVNGQVESIGGTSASAPTFAAIVSLLNEQQLKAGKSPLGFLNPWLYQNPSMLTDITVGSNPDSCCTGGYKCTTGWDPVTGLGTPVYSKMKAALP